jgi:hypothetical protein
MYIIILLNIAIQTCWSEAEGDFTFFDEEF